VPKEHVNKAFAQGFKQSLLDLNGFVKP